MYTHISNIVDNCCLLTPKPIHLFVFFCHISSASIWFLLTGTKFSNPQSCFLLTGTWNFENSVRFHINRNRNSGKVPEFGFLILFRSSPSGGSVCANIIDTKGCQKSTYFDRRCGKYVQNIIVSIYYCMI